jgi:AraC-like DNA-binding protein
MIPLSMVLALVFGYFLLIELTQPPPRNRFACAFLILLMVQFTIAGLRFGYGIEAMGRIFPITAALLGPLAFLSFQNPTKFGGKHSWPALLHLLPVTVALLLSTVAPVYIDLAQGLFTLGYAVALTLLGLRERDTFPWVDFNRREYVRRAMWCVIVLALLSATTDFVILVDGWRSQGANIPRIVGWTSVVAALLFIPYILWHKFSASRQPAAADPRTPPSDVAAETELLAQLDELLQTTQLHLDPNLNLNKIARKLGVPARQVSTAVNRQRGVSVSQFINNLRIDEACRLLKSTDLPVTRVMLQSGFITKSNFNREFSRRLGQSPSAWRNRNRLQDAGMEPG